MSTSEELPILEIGQKASITRHLDADTVQNFAALVGDTNPVHLDPTYAATTRFGAPIVHGMLIGSLISMVIGTALPGTGTLYQRQALRFVRPVYVGDTITVEVEVVEWDGVRGRARLTTTARNGLGEEAVTGEAHVSLAAYLSSS